MAYGPGHTVPSRIKMFMCAQRATRNERFSLVVAAAVNEHILSFDLGQIISLFLATSQEPTILSIADEAFFVLVLIIAFLFAGVVQLTQNL